MLNVNEVCVLIPVKRLEQSKSRLSNILKAEERSKLTLLMLEDVVDKVKRFPNVFIVTGDDKVSSFSEKHGLRSLNSRKDDLNLDLNDANSWCIQSGAKSTMILFADLPALSVMDLAKILELATEHPTAIIAPSNDGGTNVLLLQPSGLIELNFGRDSYKRHLENLRNVGVKAKIYDSVGTRLDIDMIEDIQEFIRMKDFFIREPKTLTYLESICLKSIPCARACYSVNEKRK